MGANGNGYGDGYGFDIASFISFGGGPGDKEGNNIRTITHVGDDIPASNSQGNGPLGLREYGDGAED